MYRARILSQVIIIAINGIFSSIPLAEFSHAQTPIDSPILFPLIDGDPQEERLIEGMNRGMKLDYRGAIAIFSELIQRYPDYADAYFNRGIARAKLQDHQGAIADQTKAVEIYPQLAEAYQARANIYWQLGDRQKARQDLQRALELFKSQQNLASQIEVEQRLHQWQPP